MSLYFRKAYKLFKEIPRRTTVGKNSIVELYHTTCSEPVENFNEEESVFWTSRISTLVLNNQPEKAINMFKMMRLNEQRVNCHTISSIIRACGALKSEFTTMEIHGLLIKIGFESVVSAIALLIRVYTLWNLTVAWKLYGQITHKNVFMSTSMISLCLQSRHYVEALEFFRKMQNYGIQPNHVSILSILPVCANFRALSLGKQVHGFSIRKTLFHHTSVQNSLIDMYTKCGNFKASHQVFEGIQCKDLVSWKTMIWACIENARPRIALLMLSKMHSSCIECNESILLGSISACLNAKEVQSAKQIHCYTLKQGSINFVSVGTALLQTYGRSGELSLAVNLFNQIHPKDLVAWSAMISIHAQSDHPGKSLDTFYHMKLANEKPNEVTFVSLLRACSSMGDQEVGESIHAYVIKSRYLLNTFISSILIDFYCKIGEVGQGRKVFDEIPAKNLACWNSMLNGYGLNGIGHKALETFRSMLNCGVVPDEITIISVLSACSHCGLEHEGWELFYSMKARYDISPELAHYACMVDLLSRRGHIREAFAFVTKMPMEPDKQIWGAVLVGCRSLSGCIEVAEFVVDKLTGLDPQNSSYHVILSNLYAEQGRWGVVEKLREGVDEKGLKKAAGFSLVRS